MKYMVLYENGTYEIKDYVTDDPYKEACHIVGGMEWFSSIFGDKKYEHVQLLIDDTYGEDYPGSDEFLNHYNALASSLTSCSEYGTCVVVHREEPEDEEELDYLIGLTDEEIEAVLQKMAHATLLHSER